MRERTVITSSRTKSGRGSATGQTNDTAAMDVHILKNITQDSHRRVTWFQFP